MCLCAQTKMLSQDEAFPPTIKKKLEKRQEVPGWKKDPPMFQQGPYHGQNPHPFKEHTAEVWQRFWGAVPYIGKNKLQNPRWMYEDQPEHSRRRKCYWSEVDPHDLWHTLKRENEDWQYNIDDTWGN